MSKSIIIRVAFFLWILLFLNSAYALYYSDNKDSQSSTLGSRPEYAPGRIIIKFKPAAAQAFQSASASSQKSVILSFDALNAKFKVKKISLLFPKKPLGLIDKAQAQNSAKQAPDLSAIYILETDAGTDIEKAVEEYKKDPNVEYAEPDRVVHVQMVPDDPYYHSSGSWGQSYDDLWGIKKIQCENAWDTTQGEGIVVAVIDTGVDYNHEDLADNIWNNINEIAGNGIDDDNNGFIDDVQGWDFANNDNDPMDGYGHGTHCAGIIAAKGNNSVGVIGVAWKAKIMPLKGLSDVGSGYESDLARCIIYAADNGANVLSNSWGGIGKSQLTEDVITYAYSKGCLIIASAGNDGGNSFYTFPANSPHCITVGASNIDDDNALFSNYGKVDCYAPGVDILSLRAAGTDMYGDVIHLVPENDTAAKYYRASGTSMAAPHVAGVAALVWSNNTGFSNINIRDAILLSCDPLQNGPAMNEWYYYGRVNANKAYQIGNPEKLPVVQLISPAYGLIARGEKIIVQGVVAGGANAACRLEWTNGYLESGWHVFYTQANCATTEISAALDTSILPEGMIKIRLVGEMNLNDGRVVWAQDRVNIFVGNTLKKGWPLIYGTTGYGGYNPGCALIIDDINADGQKEIIWSSESQKVYVLKGDGSLFSGSWPKDIPGGQSGSTPASIGDLAAGDINNDGLPEVITVNGFNGLNSDYSNVYAWNIRGENISHFPTAINGAGDGSFLANSLSLIDINNDSAQDILFNFERLGKIYALDSAGDVITGWPAQSGEWSSGLAAGDLYGDRNIEIAAASVMSMYLYRPDGSICPNWPQQITGRCLGSPVIGDVDGDGIKEIVLAVSPPDDDYYNKLLLYIWNPDGTLIYKGTPAGMEVNPYWRQNSSSVGLADIDNDGKAEIVIAANTKVAVVKSDGSVLLGWPVSSVNGYAGNFDAAKVLIADIDADNDFEVIVSSYPQAWASRIAGGGAASVYAWHHDGKPVTGFPIALSDTGDLGGGWRSGAISINSIAIGDIDNDGKLDLVAVVGNSAFTCTEKIYAFNLPKSNILAGNCPWPMPKHDPRHTGCYETVDPAVVQKILSFTRLYREDPLDINKDGKVDGLDIFEMQQNYPLVFKYLKYLPSYINLSILDVNGDQIIDQKDMNASIARINDAIKGISNLNKFIQAYQMDPLDVNGDGLINTADANKVRLMFDLTYIKYTDPALQRVLDVDGNGVVNNNDKMAAAEKIRNALIIGTAPILFDKIYSLC